MESAGTDSAAAEKSSDANTILGANHMNSKLLLTNSLVTTLWLLIAIECRADDPSPAANPTADSMLGKEVGDVRDDNGLKMKLIWCPRGPFTMMDKTDANPAINVLLSDGYWLGKYEVIQEEWVRLMSTEPWKGKNRTNAGDALPASWVDWGEAMEFCRRLTKQERTAGRLPRDWVYTLPTDAQWYRACSAGTDTRYSFGDDESKLGEYAWFTDNTGEVGESSAQPVGRKKPNLWGFHDLHGNVWEWCRDSYTDALPGGRDPDFTTGTERVLRGGGWRYLASGCRSTARRGSEPSNRFMDIGFRIALNPAQPSP
ncbi:MAG: formylglycine-generating enzyme family protein [Planctomycetaceae bacterium]|nr:formylglycine-generating enzyme family protein [Planctomycetaceae bacterium]